MPQSTATLSIKTVCDGQELTQGLQRQSKQVTDFARDTELATAQAAKAIAAPPAPAPGARDQAAQDARQQAREEREAAKQLKAEQAAAAREAREQSKEAAAQARAQAREAAQEARARAREEAAAAREAARQQAELGRAQQRVLQEIKSPLERQRDRHAEINRLQREGLLTAEQAARANKLISPDPKGALATRRDAALDQLKAGNLPGVAAEGVGALFDLGKAITTALGPAGQIAVGVGAALAAAITGIAAAARQASREVESLNRLAERIGTGATQAGGLSRALANAGVEDPERTLTRFNQHIGQAINDRQGSSADAFRQLGIDPARLASQDTEQTFRDTVQGINALQNAYQRTAVSQELFGRGSLELQELFRRGLPGLDRGARQAELAAPSPETQHAAREAEAAWKRLSDEWGAVQAEVTRAQQAGGARASGFFANVTGSALRFIGITRTLPEGGPAASALTPRTPGAIQAERELNTFRDRTRLGDTLLDQARELGLVGANATRREAEAVRDLVEWRQTLLRTMRNQNATAAEIAKVEVQAAQAARGRVKQQTEAVRESIRELERQQQFQGEGLRAQARALGFAGAGASQADAGQVKDLVEKLDEFSRRPNVTAEQIEQQRQKLAKLAQARRDDASAGQVADAKHALALREQVELRGLSARQEALALAAARERQALARGTKADDAAALRQIEEKNDLLNRGRDILAGLRTPQDQFNDQRAVIQELLDKGKLTGDQADRAIGQEFNKLVQGLGTGPSSFGLSGTDSRSREGLLRADDFKVRGELAKDPAALAQRQIEAVQNMERTLETRLRDISRQLGQAGIVRRAPS